MKIAMKHIEIVFLIILLTLSSCNKEEDIVGPSPDGNITIKSHDASISAPFGDLDYRVYYPEELTDETFVIHVSRGGNGIGDDRGELAEYVKAYVQEGYLVVQVDHRFAGSDIEQIAQFRGEEIQFIGQQVAQGNLNYGNFKGSVDGTTQGYAGHSGGCMEGLMAAGTEMSHGNYHVPQIKSVYGMSPAGYNPDQFGITQNPIGYSQINETAVFVIIGEEEKDINGPGTFMAEDWRLQAFESMNTNGPRFQALVKGINTDHMDIKGENSQVQNYNIDNSLAVFDMYLRGDDRSNDIGNLSLPDSNEIELREK
jgi:hypothetical protein